MKSIQRTSYLDRLLQYKDKHIIKVVTGVRRCGKSTLLQQFRELLKEDGVKDISIISINFEDLSNESLCTYKALYDHVVTRLPKDGPYYLFFDEIQMVEDFQKAIDSLYIRPNVDIYITGSNAYMLSGELATLLSGRYVEIRMLPLSFAEFVSGHDEPHWLPQLYTEYVRFGSFPYVLAFERQDNAIHDYLEGIYNTVILKDVMSRNRIPDKMMLDSVIRYAFDNIANIVSTKSIADSLTSNGRKIDTKTVERYLSAFEDSFVLYKASRYDIRGKQFLKTLGKYYLVDPGLRNMLLGNRKYDTGRVLENVVYLELMRRYGKVYIGKCDNLEVDFVVMTEKGLLYFQVSETTRDAITLQRELAPFSKINDNYPKILLTLDEDPETDYDGVRKINALQWLMENK